MKLKKNDLNLSFIGILFLMFFTACNNGEYSQEYKNFDEFNKIEKARYLVEKMLDGTNVALITDAGTPGISDPGEELVKQCHEAGVELTSLPGPAACITALTAF